MSAARSRWCWIPALLALVCLPAMSAGASGRTGPLLPAAAPIRSAQADSASPAAPVLASPADGNTVLTLTPTLIWHPAMGAVSYEVEVALDHGFTQIVADSAGVPDTLKTIGLLRHRQTYYWQVRATDGHIYSPWSDSRSFTTGTVGSPILVSPPNGAANQLKNVAMLWRHAVMARTYRIQVAVDSLFSAPAADVSGITDTTKTIGPFFLETRYFWRVAAVAADTSSAWSPVWSFIVRGVTTPLPASPADSALNQPSTLSLRWHPVPATSYEVALAGSPTFPVGSDTLTAITDSSVTVGPLHTLTWYFWQVRAADGNVFGSWSPTRAFQTAPAATVYPGDANNDGTVDARDLLRIGVYFGLTGPARQDTTLTWGPKVLVNPWASPNEAACYADCNGDGVVDQRDIVAIIQNWKDRAGLPALQMDRTSVCLEILQFIDENSQAPGMAAVRSAVVDYMSKVLGHPLAYRLERNVPNPFRTATSWMLTVPRPTEARFAVYDPAGKLVWSAVLPNLPAGTTAITWTGLNHRGLKAPAGVYYYRLTAGAFRASGRVLLAR